ncbi:glycosyltransferase family 4 protein [Maridesulfovibrio sp. FT414]|uniref:glycosyltransferase family 4 protein n=1 Tax=Maridesulfovibrio sp. FT414 TaxID=2979469 RepID=UPI003D8062A4
MKVLHILSQTPDFTGSGKYVLEMIDQSRKQGNENFLVAGTPCDFDLPNNVLAPEKCLFVRFGHDLDFPIVGMSDAMPYTSTVCSTLTADQIENYRKAFRRVIAQAVKDFSPDVIHTNHLWMVSAVTREAAPGIPVVTTCHGTCLRQHKLCPDLGRSLIKNLSGIDRIIALFEDQKAEIQELLNFPAERISMISGGFNNQCFFHEQEIATPDTVQLLYAGKLNVSKGVPWLLRSLQSIKDCNFHLHMAGGGSGPEKELCLKLAASLGDRVTVHGILSHQELGRLMRLAHIFILPSFFEGLPLVLLEAMACGCRIITTDLPGARKLFTPPHPTMVRMIELPPLKTVDRPHPEDEPELEKRLAGIILEGLADVAGGAAPDTDYIRSTSEPYTWETIFSRVQDEYLKALNGRAD